jgi:hypothetical protein
MARTSLFKHIAPSVVVMILVFVAAHVKAQTNDREAGGRPIARDGQHDFDFEIGTWKTKLKRLVSPLSGSKQWAEYEGTTVVTKVWNGKANLVELVADGVAGHFEGLSLRLYNPASRQWSLNFANIRSGTLVTPTIGEFRNGVGEFYCQDTYNERAVLVRFIITKISDDACHFEQAFSEDGGKTWEINWIADDTRVPEKK